MKIDRQSNLGLTLKQIETFIWVADLGSFRRAAERLNTTQPNISARIASLEALLGSELMLRDAGSVRITPKGRDLLVHARRVLAATDALLAASDAADQVAGTLRVGVTELIVQTWLRDYLKALKDRFPLLTVELTVEMSATLDVALVDRSIDLALQNAPFARPQGGSLALGVYPLIWVAAPGVVNDSALVDHPILVHARNTQIYSEVTAHFAKRKALPRLVPSSNLALSLHMALNGMGVAVLPAAMVKSEVARAELVQIPYDWTPSSLEFFARYEADRAAAVVQEAAMVAVTVAGVFNQD